MINLQLIIHRRRADNQVAFSPTDHASNHKDSSGQQECTLWESVLQEEEAVFHGLDEYDALVFRIFGDGRNYIANIRTDNWIIGGKSDDVWQAFILARYDKILQLDGTLFPSSLLPIILHHDCVTTALYHAL